MPATQDIDGSGRLLPSIVRLNSESDIDEVINEEVTRLPVLVNNNIGEGELKEKWWMRQSNRFNIRSIKAKQKKAWHKKVSFHQQLPPLQGRGILQNTGYSTQLENTYSTSDIPEDNSSSNIFRPWRIRHNSIFSQSGYAAMSTDELNQSSTSTILSKPSLYVQSHSDVSSSNKGVQLLDLGQLQNNNANVPVHTAAPIRRKPPRLYNRLSTKAPNYEFCGFLNSPEKSSSFFVINGEVENQLVESTANIRNMPKQINREIVPAVVDDGPTETEHSPAVRSITFDGSVLGDQESQVSINNTLKSTISITQQIDVNVPVDDNTSSSQGQRSINMQINITLPTEINAAAVKRDIMPQPLKLKQPKPTQSQETTETTSISQVDNTLQTLIKESHVHLPELAADSKKKKPRKSGIVIKHLIPCAPKPSIDWDNYPDMMINGTKFGEYVYRGLQASAAAVLSRIIDKLYRQLGKGKAKDLAKLLRSLKGDLSNLVDHVELMKLLRDPAVRKLLAQGLDKETAKQFQALLAHMFKNGKIPPGMEGDLFQLFNGGLLDNPELTDELLDALQDTNPAQEIALLCSLLNNPDISAEEKEMIKEMLRKKLAGDGTNQKLVATLLEMINNGTIDASMFGDGTMDINEIIEQLKQGKMSDDLVSAVLQMMENGVLNSSVLVDDDDGGMMSKILQALREGNSAILGDDEDGITSKILKALKEGKIDMKTALKAILEAKSNKKGGVLDKIMKKISRSARRRHRRNKRRRRHGSGSSYSDSSDYSSDDDSGSWTSSSYDSSSYTSGGERKHRRRKKHRRHHRRRGSGDEYSSSYSSSYYSSDESEFEFTRSGKHRYARDRKKHRRHRTDRDSKGRSRRSKHKGGLGDDSDFDPNDMSNMRDIADALALCKDVSGEAQMEYYKKRREEALKEKEAQDEKTKWLRLAQERRQAAELTLEEKMMAEQLAREEAEEARRRYVEEYLDEARLELEKQLERKRLENEIARLGMEDNVTRTIREQQRLMEQKFKTEAQRQRIAEQMEKLRKERTDRRIELQYEHLILNEYDDYVAVWEEQELEYIKYYCGEECVARVMKAHAEKMARRAKERAARERAILEALQDELMGTLEMIKTKHTLGYLKEGERLEMMHNSARSYFSYFCFVDYDKDKE